MAAGFVRPGGFLYLAEGHPIVVTAVARAGLRIEFLHEHPAPAGPGGQDDAGRAERRRLVPAGAPALFSLRARAS